jgi:hypothetical protein
LIGIARPFGENERGREAFCVSDCFRGCEGKKRREHRCGHRGAEQLRSTLLFMAVRLLDLSRIWRQRLAEIAIRRGHFPDQCMSKSPEVTDFLPAHFSYR